MADAVGEVEEAIAGLGRGDPDAARNAIVRAVISDRSLGPVADAVALACAELEGDGEISPAAWNALADACPAEARPAVEAWRR
jgi:hypothetical protein